MEKLGASKYRRYEQRDSRLVLGEQMSGAYTATVPIAGGASCPCIGGGTVGAPDNLCDASCPCHCADGMCGECAPLSLDELGERTMYRVEMSRDVAQPGVLTVAAHDAQEAYRLARGAPAGLVRWSPPGEAISPPEVVDVRTYGPAIAGGAPDADERHRRSRPLCVATASNGG